MRKTDKYLLALFSSLLLVSAVGLSAQSFPGTGIRRVVDSLYEYTGSQIFDSNVTVGGNLAVTGTQTFTGTTTIPTATITTAGVTTLNVSGTSTFTGPIVSPLVTGAAGQGLYAWGTKVLTEAGGAETVLTITTASTEMTGGTLQYTVALADTAATPDDHTQRTGHFQFGMANNATVVICTADASDQTNDDSFLTQQGVAKTLTYAIAATAGTSTCVISFNIDSDIATVTSATITWTLQLNGPGAVS